MANFYTLLSVVLIVSSVTAYPRRPTNVYLQTTTIAATETGTCASIGFTTRCCPPDEDCMAIDNDQNTDPCYCSSDCHTFGDCCSDIVNICPDTPRTCTELGFIGRCCEDPLSLGYCEIESIGCSCKSSCFIDENCCPDIGCSPTNCAEARLDPGCCTGVCNVTYGTNGSETCYCDDRCRENGDCCEDVNQTKQCSPSCTLTIMPGNSRTKMQEARANFKLNPLQLAKRYQNRLRKFMGRSQASIRQSSTQRAYVDERNNMRERLGSLLESRRARAQIQRNNKRS